MSISELGYLHSPETRFRGFLTTLKRLLQGGSNFFALGPPIKKAAPTGWSFLIAGAVRVEVA